MEVRRVCGPYAEEPDHRPDSVDRHVLQHWAGADERLAYDGEADDKTDGAVNAVRCRSFGLGAVAAEHYCWGVRADLVVALQGSVGRLLFGT